MNIKKKGKVHPSPPPPLPSFPSSSSKEDHCLSVLKLLPAVILLLVSSLSPDDKQVLAYLITRSAKTTTTTTTSGRRNSSCSSSKNKKAGTHHKAPVFDCDCFDCYTSYWLRWDSSPNRELIHQIIEAYEDHLTAESEKPNGRGRKKNKKKEKSRGRRGVVENSGRPEEPVEPVVAVKPEEESPEMLRFPVAAATRPHKGLARKLLPDVMGLFNWRFWRLWNPNA